MTGQSQPTADERQRMIAWVRGFLLDGSSLVDVGANYGHFLRTAQTVYPDAVGFDLSPQAKSALARVSLGFGGPTPRLARGLPLRHV